jgi:sulfur-oxidizing protein SoxY
MRRRLYFAGLAWAMLALAWTGTSVAQSESAWVEIRANIVGERPIEDGAALLALEVPGRAEDAALVPVTIRLNLPEASAPIARLILVVDENPAPVVGIFTFPAGQRAFNMSTRLRVNSYSFVRAILETADGRLAMVKHYVKAAGGCSAPAGKDPQEARAHLGEMRFRTFADPSEAQIQLRHPNYSGLQMDQITRLYTPAWYVETLTLRQGDMPLFSLTGGISISEDPTFRFSYRSNGAPVTVEARDTEGRVFQQTFPAEGGS